LGKPIWEEEEAMTREERIENVLALLEAVREGVEGLRDERPGHFAERETGWVLVRKGWDGKEEVYTKFAGFRDAEERRMLLVFDTWEVAESVIAALGCEAVTVECFRANGERVGGKRG